MAYSDVALLANDWDFLNRCAACVAGEPWWGPENPTTWVAERSWQLAATPGFGDKYASAIAGGVPNPGTDPSVISDPEILSAVQLVHADDPVPEP